MKKAPINKIISFSNVDGPGNRCAIFFQGCTMNCLYCHNPETIAVCNDCGDCVKGCPTTALKIHESKVMWDEKQCVQCDQCTKRCTKNSSCKIHWMSVEDVVAKVKQLRPFIQGVTCSGGECMLYADFLLELFKEIKKLGLTCLIDSNGTIDFERHKDLLMECDGVMLDVKAVDADFHQWLTSHSPEIVFKNLRYLQEVDKLAEVRTVILPGFNKENHAVVRFVYQQLDPKIPYRLLQYRSYGVRKKTASIFVGEIDERDIEQLIQTNNKEL
ncbi:MAG: YjjW family glycine radical enzyme activase [Anaerorhabdus sp.]